MGGWRKNASGAWVQEKQISTVRTAAVSAAGNTAIWTPTSGKKFNLMKLVLEVTANASNATGGVCTIDLKDGPSNSIGVTFSLYLPTAAGTTFGAGYVERLDFGELGILSAAADNVLNANLSLVLTTGVARFILMGTEE